MTHFGTSAKYIDAQKKIALVPRKDFELASVRTMLSTGSPLAPESFDYVYQCVKQRHLPVVDLGRHRHRVVLRARRARRCRCGAASCSAAASGMDVDVFDDDGQPVRRRDRASSCASRRSRRCRCGFWNDPDGAKYRAAYFERFPGRLVPRRLGRDHRARRPHHLRPLGRDAEPGRRAHRHRRDLSPGRAACRKWSRAS